MPADKSYGAADRIDRDWAAVIASASGLTLSVGTITLYSFGVFVRPLAFEFHWSRTAISAGVTISQYSFALTSLLWGFLADRFGPRAVVVPAVVGLSVGVASLSLLTFHLWHFYLIFALIPLIGGGASPIGYAAVLVRRFDLRLGQALGLSLMGVGIGATVLPRLAQKLVTQFGWREAYALLGVISLLVTLPAAFVATRNTRGAVMTRVNDNRIPIVPLIASRAFLLMCTTFILLGVVSIGAVAHLIPMMTDRGFSPEKAAGIAGLTGLATILSRGGIGWVLDRVHAPRVLAVLALIAASGLLLLAYGRSSVMSYVAALLVGVVTGAEVDFIAFLVRRYFGAAAFGRLYGLAFGLFILGSGTGPILLGLSFDHGGYRVGLMAFSALSIAASLITFAMPTYSRNSLSA